MQKTNFGLFRRTVTVGVQENMNLLQVFVC